MIGIGFLFRLLMVLFWMVVIGGGLWLIALLGSIVVRKAVETSLQQYDSDLKWWGRMFLLRPWRFLTAPVLFAIMLSCIGIFLLTMVLSGQGAGGSVIP